MSALTLNGIEVPLLADGVSLEDQEIGERARAFSGSTLATVRARKRVLSGTFETTDATTATALRGLINGDGYGWDFAADLFANYKGLGPDSGHDGTQSGSGGVFDGKVSVASSGTLPYTLDSTWSTWTVSVWLYESAAWHHYVVNSSAKKWLDGASNDGATTTWLTMSSGVVTLAGGSGRDFDELVAVPYVMPATWPAIIYAYGNAWPKPPFLAVAGDIATGTFRGRASRTALESVNGSTMQSVDFVLEED